MKPPIQINDLRRMLKAIGFNVRVHSNSLGRFGRVEHTATGRSTTIGGIVGDDSVTFWQPATVIIEEYHVLDSNLNHVMFA
jgi:hypothetical protein